MIPSFKIIVVIKSPTVFQNPLKCIPRLFSTNELRMYYGIWDMSTTFAVELTAKQIIHTRKKKNILRKRTILLSHRVCVFNRILPRVTHAGYTS